VPVLKVVIRVPGGESSCQTCSFSASLQGRVDVDRAAKDVLSAYSPSRVMDRLDELIQLGALCITKRARLLVATGIVNVHLVGHGVACRTFWVGGGVVC
jgi:hypothetical protein